MRKIVFIFVVVFNAPLAYGGLITTNTSNYCDNIEMAPSLQAVFEPNEYTCASGYYLPANHDGCEPCPTEHTCSGGTFTFDENNSQGISYNPTITSGYNYGCDQNVIWGFHTVFEPNSHDCLSGYYLPANIDECTICPANSACIGGTYSFNETTDQGIQSCANGTFAPTGSAVCYPHILHVGDSKVYLKSTKQTTPSLNIKIGNDVFYANMTTTRTRMSKDSSHYLHVKTADNIHYYVCDDTICPQ